MNKPFTIGITGGSGSGKKRKGKGGFGYDPIFMPVGFSKTLAQMSMEEKNQISHRARATEKLVEFLNNFHAKPPSSQNERI